MSTQKNLEMDKGSVNWAEFFRNILSTTDTFINVAISDALRAGIASGRLPPGTRLPSTRALASLMQVSAVTVATAFSTLIAEGLLAAQVGRGTFVRAVAGYPASSSVQPVPIPAPVSVSALGGAIPPDPAIWLPPRRPGERQHLVSRWMAAIDPSNGINLVSGYADYRLPPAQAYQATLGELLARTPQLTFDFCPSAGHPEARAMASGFVASQFGIEADEVFVGASVHGFLDIIVRTFLQPGDVVACESPTYYGMLDLLALAGIKVVSIPGDDEGILPDGLASVLKAHQPKLIYLTACTNQPTGRAWPAERRDAVAALIRQSPVIVVEDGSLISVAYDDRSHTLKSVDETGQVIFLCSFSKILFPALRVAIAACSLPIAARLIVMLQSHVRLQASLPQCAVMHYVSSKAYQADMAAARVIYASRCVALSSALVGPRIRYLAPSAGFSLWVELAGGLSGEELCQRLSKRQIYALPGDIFVSFPNNIPAVRLAFGQTDEVDLAKAGAVISELWTDGA